MSTEMVDVISRLIDVIPWPERRRAMGDITQSLLDGKHRVAEPVFGWNRCAVELGGFFWKGIRTVARLMDAAYEKGVTVCGGEKSELEKRLKCYYVTLVGYNHPA